MMMIKQGYYVFTVGEFFARFDVPEDLKACRALFSDDDFVHVYRENGKIRFSFRAR